MTTQSSFCVHSKKTQKGVYMKNNYFNHILVASSFMGGFLYSVEPVVLPQNLEQAQEVREHELIARTAVEQREDDFTRSSLDHHSSGLLEKSKNTAQDAGIVVKDAAHATVEGAAGVVKNTGRLVKNLFR